MSVAEAGTPLDCQVVASRSTAGVWLGVVAALLVMRLPMSFLFLLIAPWIILMAQTRFPSRLRVTPLVAVEACCVVASGVAVVLFHLGVIADTGNSASIMLAVIGVTLVVFRSANPGRVARQVLNGLYWGAILVWLIGMGEIATGVKLLPLLYPGANTLGAVSKSRWIVTATYPNYNDYGVVMAMLFTAVLARLWFNPKGGAVRLGRLFILATCLAMVLIGGSRGALFGCICAVILLFVLNVRRLHTAAMGVRAFFWGGALVLVLGAGLNVAVAPEGAASVRGEGSEASRGDLLVEIAERFTALYRLFAESPESLTGPGELRAAVEQLLSTLGRRVRAELPGGGVLEGTAVGLGPGGTLRVRHVTPDHGTIETEVSAGDVAHLRGDVHRGA